MSSWCVRETSTNQQKTRFHVHKEILKRRVNHVPKICGQLNHFRSYKLHPFCLDLLRPDFGSGFAKNSQNKAQSCHKQDLILICDYGELQIISPSRSLSSAPSLDSRALINPIQLIIKTSFLASEEEGKFSIVDD